jgi:hypothetical protein
MGQQNNPIDPRSPAFFYTFVDKGGRGSGRPSGDGCGCAMLALAVAIALLVGALT